MSGLTDTVGTGAQGAAAGGALGSIGGPVGTAIGAGIGALVGGIGGLFSGRSRRKEAEQRAREQAKLARIDTEYSPFVKQSGYKVEPQAYTPGGAQGALAGIAAGGLQGLNVYRGLKQDDMQARQLDLLKSLANKQPTLDLNLPMSNQSTLGSSNVYSMLNSGAA